MNDLLGDLREAVAQYLQEEMKEAPTKDARLPQPGHWRPHLYQPTANVAWHLLTELPDSDRWAVRMKRASEKNPGLRLGVAAPDHIAQDHDVIEAADEMAGQILVLEGVPDRAILKYSSAADLVYERNLMLPHSLAAQLLDRNFDRAVTESDGNRKGVLLEVCLALVLSQVSGFEVQSRGVSSRTQQMDVWVHNRVVGGVLGDGALVLGEAKNWTTEAVGVKEYGAFLRKLQTRRGRAKLGFLISSGRISQDAYQDAMRDSHTEDLVVMLDKPGFTGLWRTGDSITTAVERAVLNATIDQRP